MKQIYDKYKEKIITIAFMLVVPGSLVFIIALVLYNGWKREQEENKEKQNEGN